MNFRAESEHDKRLMALIVGLDHIGRLDILESGLALPPLGRLHRTGRRQKFDVEAVFERRRLLVETKVDSDEGGRREADGDPKRWQTVQIAALAEPDDVCLFITYGYSEFFTKGFDTGPAAAASGFRHVRLDDMTAMVEVAAPLLGDPAVSDWLGALRLERIKRMAMPNVLAAYGTFRRTYLDIGGEVDFSVTRLGVNAPEMAFPAFDQFRRVWNSSLQVHRYGRLALYPVNRRFVALPDAVLNWRELWFDHDEFTLGGTLPCGARALYFEVNEDFNLHLKLDLEDESNVVDAVRTEAARRLTAAPRTAGLVADRPEFHRQGTYAIWEWDLELPTRIAQDGATPAVGAIGALLDEVVPRLS